MIKRGAIDAGHGGSDPGAVAHGLRESDVVLKIAKMVEDKLEARYLIDIVQTRNFDVYIAPDKRDDIAEQLGAQFFLSIHLNSAEDPKAHGFESFRHPSASETTRQIHTMIHAEVVKFMTGQGIRDRGQKVANFAVLRESDKMPAILLELGFISNKDEAAKFKDPRFLDGLTDAIVAGIVRAFGLTAKPAPTPKKLYVVRLPFSQKEVADNVCAELKKKYAAAAVREEEVK